MKNAIRSWLLEAGLYVSRYRHRDRVGELIRAMQPRHDQSALIRVGGEGDGGYLVPDDLQGIEAVFSPGVADQIVFELGMMERGVRSHLLDGSIDNVPPGLTNFTFERKYLGPRDGGKHTTLATWFKKHASLDDQNDYLLQMDIEGAEYEILRSTPSELLQKFRIVIVEFHHLHEVFHPIYYQTISDALYHLLTLFEVAHVHPNNLGFTVGRGSLRVPSLLEVTFVRKDRFRESSARPSFPHPLDRKCIPDRPELVLPPGWWS